MVKKHAARVIAAIVAVGVIGALAWRYLWDPQPTYPPSSSATVAISDDELAAAADTRVWFAHMSVGKNILAGVKGLYEGSEAASPSIVEVAPGSGEQLPQGPVLAHTLVGDNGHPLRKLATFDAMARAGLADQVDVAALKFCYLDIRWYSDVDEVFTAYRDTLSALERDYPDVRFLHLTVPVTTGPYGIKDHLKVLLGRDDNAARERFNERIRATYPADQTYDIALIESTSPQGEPSLTLRPGYTNDGSHLNATGSALAAAGFLKALG